MAFQFGVTGRIKTVKPLTVQDDRGEAGYIILRKMATEGDVARGRSRYGTTAVVSRQSPHTGAFTAKRWHMSQRSAARTPKPGFLFYRAPPLPTL